MNAIKDLTSACSGAYVTEREARQALFQRYIPKLRYAMVVTSWTEHQCKAFDACIRSSFIPQMKLNRNLPDAVLFGAVEHGGMDIPNARTLQDQVQFEYILKQLRWDKIVANDFLTTLDCVQLRSGLTKPLLEDTQSAVEYLGASYVLDMRNRLAEIGGSLWVEKKWTEKNRSNPISSAERRFQIPY